MCPCGRMKLVTSSFTDGQSSWLVDVSGKHPVIICYLYCFKNPNWCFWWFVYPWHAGSTHNWSTRNCCKQSKMLAPVIDDGIPVMFTLVVQWCIQQINYTPWNSHSTWKWMAGILVSFWILGRPIFRCELLVLGRVPWDCADTPHHVHGCQLRSLLSTSLKITKKQLRHYILPLRTWNHHSLQR